MNQPGDALEAGQAILDPVLVPHGFQFALRDAGRGSGGHFASGEYVRGSRRLELHYRWSLGLVTYHLADAHATHEAYVRMVHGRPGGNAYPGFSDDRLDAFRHLRHDLESYGEAFLRGSDPELSSLLSRAAQAEQQKPRGLRALPD